MHTKVTDRILTNPRTALERQIWESVAIDRMSSRSPEGCLNLKSEWGQSRTPALMNKDNFSGRKRPEKEKKGRRCRDREGSGMCLEQQ